MQLLKDMTDPEIIDLLNAMESALKATASIANVESPKFLLLIFNDPKVTQYIHNLKTDDDVERRLLEALLSFYQHKNLTGE